MYHSLGIALIVIGLIHLVAHEPVVRIKRAFKPWWRDDADPAEDAKLSDCLRAITFVGGVGCVELGIWLSEATYALWPWRVAIYGIAGALALFVRQVVR